ncbi:uncharacterized protein LOC129628937 isoform X5 [Bubalus kerabau]|uniref:uncharacterized protein LOC129628937 isoform X5 n=1 Tax=Bubalus carabanensis TaxID=3119969 RepID=UPI00244E5F32|nr:uncharacterized protein LOC129628937 isoform X5 [Bubalus carabanensis]
MRQPDVSSPVSSSRLLLRVVKTSAVSSPPHMAGCRSGLASDISASWEAHSKMGDCQCQADREWGTRYTCWEHGSQGQHLRGSRSGWGGKLNSEAAATLARSSEGLVTWRRHGQKQETRRVSVCPRTLAPCPRLPEILKAKAEEFEAFMT